MFEMDFSEKPVREVSRVATCNTSLATTRLFTSIIECILQFYGKLCLYLF